MSYPKAFQDLYSTNLLHRLSSVKDQLDFGLYTTKRFAKYLQKVCNVRVTASRESIKFADHEAEKKERIMKDKMGPHVAAYNAMLNIQSQMATAELSYSNSLLSKVVDPLLNFHRDALIKQKKFLQQEAKMEATQTQYKNDIKRERLGCLKSWKELQDMNKLVEESKVSGKNKDKNEKNYAKQREKTMKIFAKYESLVDAANAELKNYWSKDLPLLISSMELLECDRLTEFDARLAEYRKLVHQFQEPFPNINSLVDNAVKALDIKGEMRSFVEKEIQSHGLPKPPPLHQPALPVPSSQLQNDSSQLTKLLLQDVETIIHQRATSSMNDINVNDLSDTPPVRGKSIEGKGAEGGVTGRTSGAKSLSGVPPTYPSNAPANNNAPSSAAAASSSPSLTTKRSGSPSPTQKDESVPIPNNAINSVSYKTRSVRHVPTLSSSFSSLEALFDSPDPFHRVGDPPILYVRALYDFKSDDADDLSFNAADIIRVTLKGEDEELASHEQTDDGSEEDARWWRGYRLLDIGRSEEGTFPSNYVKEISLDTESIPMRMLIDIPSGLLCFGKFLELEHSAENLNFVSAVERYRNMIFDNELPAAERQAKFILNHFISNTATEQININGGIQSKLCETLKASFESGDQSFLIPSFFDDAQKEIMKLLVGDTFQRFKKSELFGKYQSYRKP